MKKQRDKKLAKELAAHLDAGMHEPTDADSAEMQDLLAIYACLDNAVEEPSPKLQRWVKRLLKESSFRERVAAWVGRFRERWLSWLPRRLHPALAAGVMVVVAFVAVQVFLRAPRQLSHTANNEEVLYRNTALAEQGAYDAHERGRTVEPDSPPEVAAGLVTEFETGDGAGWALATSRLSSGEAGGQVRYYGAVEVQDAADAVQPGAVAPADDGSSGDGRMVVRRASLALVVQDAEAGFARVQEIAADQGGGVFSLETGKTAQGSLQTTVSIQVPVDACDSTLAQLRALDAELIAERVTSQDVTAEYVDLDARARNLELAEGEIQELLESAQERGEKSREILKIYDELVDIRQRIEQLKGQMVLLSHSAALARIDVALIPEEIAPEPPAPAGFDAGHVLREAWEEVVRIFENIATFFIRTFAYAPLILPPVLVVVLAVWLVVRKVRRRNAEADKEDAVDK
jgi:hypothetical protein